MGRARARRRRARSHLKMQKERRAGRTDPRMYFSFVFLWFVYFSWAELGWEPYYGGFSGLY